MRERTLILAAAALGLVASPLGAQVAPTRVAYNEQLAAAPLPTTVPWPVANRAFERGEILTEQDFVTQQLPARVAASLAPLETIVGKAAARAIPYGTALRQGDVMEPQMVYRGATVKLHVRTGGIDIASSGRALSDGQRGQAIRVFSNVSSRTLDAIVEGPGVVHLAGF